MTRRRGALALTLILTFTGSLRAADEAILVSSAVSLGEPLHEAVEMFLQHRGGVEFDVQLSGSSTLAQQILRGAPVDLFLSAAPRDIRRLADAGLAHDACSVAGNRLVVVVARGVEPPRDLFDLTDERFERIAVANRKTAPLGHYTLEALRASNLLGEFEAEWIPAEHARQVVDYVARGEVDAAVVYATDAERFADRVQKAFAIAINLHTPIEYQAALVSDDAPASAAAFLEYLCSEGGRAIFERHGFTRWSGPR